MIGNLLSPIRHCYLNKFTSKTTGKEYSTYRIILEDFNSRVKSPEVSVSEECVSRLGLLDTGNKLFQEGMLKINGEWSVRYDGLRYSYSFIAHDIKSLDKEKLPVDNKPKKE